MQQTLTRVQIQSVVIPLPQVEITMDRLLRAGLQGYVRVRDNLDKRFQRLGQVGEGTYGKVYKAMCLESNELVALKRIRLDFEKEGIGSNWREGVQSAYLFILKLTFSVQFFPITGIREIRILASLKHKNVVRLKELVTEEKEVFVKRNGIEKKDKERSVYMVFEFMDSDLAGLLLHPNLNFTQSHIKCLMKQLFEGLDYLHTRKIMHRANLLMNNKGELKLADFGLARKLGKDSKMDYTNRVITLWYRPPELLLGATKYGPEIDMWSAGCVLLELHTRKAVFPGNLEIPQLELIWKLCGSPNSSENTQWPGVVDLPWWDMIKPGHSHSRKIRESYKDLSPQALDLIDKLLQLDPLKRPSAREVLEHPYFTIEEPTPCSPSEIPRLEGDWHEFDTKQRKKEKEKSSTTTVDISQPSSPGSYGYQQHHLISNQPNLDTPNQPLRIPTLFQSHSILSLPRPGPQLYPTYSSIGHSQDLIPLTPPKYSHSGYKFDKNFKRDNAFNQNRSNWGNIHEQTTGFRSERSQNSHSDRGLPFDRNSQLDRRQPSATPIRFRGTAGKSYRKDQNSLWDEKNEIRSVEVKTFRDEINKEEYETKGSFYIKNEFEIEPDEDVIIEASGDIIISPELKMERKVEINLKETNEKRNIVQEFEPKTVENFADKIRETTEQIVEAGLEKTEKNFHCDVLRNAKKSSEHAKSNNSSVTQIQNILVEANSPSINDLFLNPVSFTQNLNITSPSSHDSPMQISADNSPIDFIQPILLPKHQLTPYPLASNLKNPLSVLPSPFSFKFTTKSLETIHPVKINSPPPKPVAAPSENIQTNIITEKSNPLSLKFELPSEISKHLEPITKSPQKKLQSKQNYSRGISPPQQKRNRSLSNDRNNSYQGYRRNDRKRKDQNQHDGDGKEIWNNREILKDRHKRINREDKNYWHDDHNSKRDDFNNNDYSHLQDGKRNSRDTGRRFNRQYATNEPDKDERYSSHRDNHSTSSEHDEFGRDHCVYLKRANLDYDLGDHLVSVTMRNQARLIKGWTSRKNSNLEES
ncbi:kinase subunit of RNA polymerase II carboxy-terminal domain kinase I [Nowakowskiella sp. JEL0078]|nr:kinase subunit of RNA polymerase II carboxy-terminal domain kinase I [Nowakowskiella sp. JEL0078]